MFSLVLTILCMNIHVPFAVETTIPMPTPTPTEKGTSFLNCRSRQILYVHCMYRPHPYVPFFVFYVAPPGGPTLKASGWFTELNCTQYKHAYAAVVKDFIIIQSPIFLLDIVLILVFVGGVLVAVTHKCIIGPFVLLYQKWKLKVSA